MRMEERHEAVDGLVHGGRVCLEIGREPHGVGEREMALDRRLRGDLLAQPLEARTARRTSRSRA